MGKDDRHSRGRDDDTDAKRRLNTLRRHTRRDGRLKEATLTLMRRHRARLKKVLRTQRQRLDGQARSHALEEAALQQKTYALHTRLRDLESLRDGVDEDGPASETDWLTPIHHFFVREIAALNEVVGSDQRDLEELIRVHEGDDDKTVGEALLSLIKKNAQETETRHDQIRRGMNHDVSIKIEELTIPDNDGPQAFRRVTMATRLSSGVPYRRTVSGYCKKHDACVETRTYGFLEAKVIYEKWDQPLPRITPANTQTFPEVRVTVFSEEHLMAQVTLNDFPQRTLYYYTTVEEVHWMLEDAVTDDLFDALGENMVNALELIFDSGQPTLAVVQHEKKAEEKWTFTEEEPECFSSGGCSPVKLLHSGVRRQGLAEVSIFEEEEEGKPLHYHIQCYYPWCDTILWSTAMPQKVLRSLGVFSKGKLLRLADAQLRVTTFIGTKFATEDNEPLPHPKTQESESRLSCRVSMWDATTTRPIGVALDLCLNEDVTCIFAPESDDALKSTHGEIPALPRRPAVLFGLLRDYVLPSSERSGQKFVEVLKSAIIESRREDNWEAESEGASSGTGSETGSETG